MIKKIAHFADIHIMNKLSTHDEIRIVHDNAIKLLEDKGVDVIIIEGDLFHDNLDTNNEAETIAGRLLNRLSKIAPVRITQGNHDINKNNPDRLDSIQNIINLIDNDRVQYLNKTDFYEEELDNSIVYAVWHHIDKKSPWLDFEKDKSKFYIDLFHDPINGCLAENSQKMEDKHYRNLSDFKGDILLLGDIHKQQDFHKNGKLFASYPSSLYETKTSEGDGAFHGFLIWDISNRENVSIEKIKVENKWSYHEYVINSGFDYDDINIELNSEILTDYSRLVIKWNDYSSFMTTRNIRHITSYIKKKYSNIVDIKTVRKPIHVNSITSKEQELLDRINDKDVQRNAFIEFLTSKKYDKIVVDDVLLLDTEINSYLTNEDLENVVNSIKIKSFRFNYFRSYGENNVIDWNSRDGVYQIKGLNANGKSTIFYFIMYMLFGKTPSTIKKEKNSDNKFINNRLDVDYTDGEMVIEINNNFYKIIKKTERKWNRTHTEITSVPTSIQYIQITENGEEVDDNSNETDKNKNKTQQLIEKSIGSYEDFVRKVYTDADTLNMLLSNDKAQFIDNILFDTGLDIFDKKFEYYKEYKKKVENKIEKLNIDPIKENENIELLKEDISSKLDIVKKLKESDLIILDERLEKGHILKDSEIKKLHKIDDSIVGLSIDVINDDVKKLKDERTSKELELLNLDKNIEELPSIYDEETLEKYKSKIEQFKEWRLNRLEDINKLKNDILINSNKKELLSNQISSIEKDIEQINKNINSEVLSATNTIQYSINDNTSKINNLESLNTSLLRDVDSYKKSIIQEKSFIEREIKNLESEILLLSESILSESCDDKSCPTCKRVYGDTELEIIKESILDKTKIVNDKKDLLNNNKVYDEYNNKIIEAENTININNINIIEVSKNNEILLNSLSSVETEIEKSDKVIQFRKDIEKLNKDILDINNEIPTIETVYNSLNQEIMSIDADISLKKGKAEEYNNKIIEIENIKKKVEERKSLILEKKSYPMFIENISLKIENKNRLIEDYNNSIAKIEENKAIETKIENIGLKIKVLEQEKNDILNKISTIENIEIVKLNNSIIVIEDMLKRFAIIEHKIVVDKAYIECIHRDGLPTTLLKKLLPNINSELSSLLENVNFNLCFDDDINLRMSNNRYESMQNVLDGSGMERTFISFVLKLTLMKISNKSRYNMLLLDEVTSKLDIENIENFKQLLVKTKDFIDKVVIIDHYNDFVPDYIIEVDTKDDISYIQ
jgi:DNA repair exonuclease SbcCD ATPase subunit